MGDHQLQDRLPGGREGGEVSCPGEGGVAQNFEIVWTLD